MINRTKYLDDLINFKDKNLIKVITGIRRCGKSTMFELFQEYLKSTGIGADQIITVNLKDGDYRNIRTSGALYEYVDGKLIKDKKNYVFLDEVQQVEKFQEAIDWLYVIKHVDLYVTRSNAFLLSGELATLLSGRYVEIKMLPLSFKEYVSAHPENTNMPLLYRNYLQNSSFPGTLELTRKQDIRTYLEGIYNTILLKDIVTRKRKQYLATGSKYYVADIGLRYFLLGTRQTDMGHILENIVYLELLRRGYEVYIGKVGDAEVDFIAINAEGEEYYQVSLSVMDEQTLKRELSALDAIKDHNPKYLLTMDYTPLTSHNGIKQIHVLDWLMKM